MSVGDYQKIYYFGDSLTDSGNLFSLTSQLVPPLPAAIPLELAGYDQKFSNGDVYSDIAPVLLGISADDVENFAVGGARAVGVRTVGDNFGLNGVPGLDPAVVNFDVNLGGQVTRFLEQAAINPPPAGSAASILIGLNDLKEFTPTAPENTVAELTSLIGDIVTSTLGAAAAVAAAGVETVIINTLPPVTFFPLIETVPPELAPFVDFAVDGINDALRTGSEALADGGVNITFVDFNSLAKEIMADPETFGIQSLTEPFLLGTGASPTVNPDALDFSIDQLAFYDLLHPTTDTHGVFGAFSDASLTSTTFVGDETDEVITGDGGEPEADLVFAAGGNDSIFLGRGDDVAFGGTGRDALFGNRGSDILAGGSGDDVAIGGSGDDLLAGGTGNDFLVGGRGNDVLIDGLNDDILKGKAGDDLFIFAESALIGGTPDESTDRFGGGKGYDTLIVALTSETLAVEQAALEANFVAGKAYTFQTFDLTINRIEDVRLQDGLGLPDDLDVGGDLASRLTEGDLWGLA